jgi:polar amino acid transport system substrate-binding protein
VKRLARGLTILAMLPLFAANADEGVTLHYYERPPFTVVDAQGHVGGSVGDRAERIFARAGIAVRWVKTPVHRTLPLLRANRGKDCSAGWYRTGEREQYLRYSLPFFRDQPPAALIRRDYPVPDHIALRDFLTRPDLRLAVRIDTAYGATIDGLIAAMPKENVAMLSGEYSAMVKMVHAGRSDALILAVEEIEPLVRAAELPMADFRVLRFPDVPLLETRHIVCSRQVAPVAMMRLDKAIRELGYP